MLQGNIFAITVVQTHTHKASLKLAGIFISIHRVQYKANSGIIPQKLPHYTSNVRNLLNQYNSVNTANR